MYCRTVTGTPGVALVLWHDSDIAGQFLEGQVQAFYLELCTPHSFFISVPPIPSSLVGAAQVATLL